MESPQGWPGARRRVACPPGPLGPETLAPRLSRRTGPRCGAVASSAPRAGARGVRELSACPWETRSILTGLGPRDPRGEPGRCGCGPRETLARQGVRHGTLQRARVTDACALGPWPWGCCQWMPTLCAPGPESAVTGAAPSGTVAPFFPVLSLGIEKVEGGAVRRLFLVEVRGCWTLLSTSAPRCQLSCF